ncbi:MAG: membrane protein, partial [bacterium]
LLFSELVAQTLERFKSFLEKHKKEHWPRKIRELSLLTKAFLKNYYVFGSSLLLSILAQGFAILAVHQLSLAVGARIDASTMFVVVPIVLLISVLPISIGGLGTREVAFVYLLTNAYLTVGIEQDFAKSAAALVAFLWLAINLLVSLPGAISYSMINNRHYRK